MTDSKLPGQRDIKTEGGNYNESIKGNYYKVQGNYYASGQQYSDRRCLRVLVHRAAFVGSIQECYFINLTNLSENREIEATHIWLESEPELHILNPQRRLPKRLRLDESWETWIEVEKIPEPIRNNPYDLFRVKLTSGDIIKSTQNKNVAKMGTVPGGDMPKAFSFTNRTINMGGGNYNERIEGDYIQGDKVNTMTNNPGGFLLSGSVGGNVNNVQGDNNHAV